MARGEKRQKEKKESLDAMTKEERKEEAKVTLKKEETNARMRRTRAMEKAAIEAGDEEVKTEVEERR